MANEDANRVRDLLGDWWDYVVTDASEGDGGNDERLAFLYDTRKVKFGRVAGEVVLPPVTDEDGNEVPATQFVRTPFLVGFEAGWFRFMLTTVHVHWGDEERAVPQRVSEVEAIAQFLANRLGQTGTWARNLILLGDFNIFDVQSPAYQAILNAGFNIPDALTTVPATNAGEEPRKYDQIAFLLAEHPNLQPANAGVFDFFESVYSDAKLPLYEDGLVKADGTPPANPSSYYRHHWRRRQMSDHLLMWVELPIEFAEPYLEQMAE
jgi:endonuclease/exonuclease/phosphatase family metal-dependent hydrolase